MTLARARALLLRKYLSNHCPRRSATGEMEGNMQDIVSNQKSHKLPHLRTASVRVGAYFFSSACFPLANHQLVPRRSSVIPAIPTWLHPWIGLFLLSQSRLSWVLGPDPARMARYSPVFFEKLQTQVLGNGRFQTGTIELHCSSRHDDTMSTQPWKIDASVRCI